VRNVTGHDCTGRNRGCFFRSLYVGMGLDNKSQISGHKGVERLDTISDCACAGRCACAQGVCEKQACSDIRSDLSKNKIMFVIMAIN
jgi:hypothetical protein